MQRSTERPATEITVVGGGGGRLDHELSTALLLAHNRYQSIIIRAILGSSIVSVVRPGRRFEVVEPIRGPLVGSTLSLIAAGGVAKGIRTQGLRWPLVSEDLEPGETRGMSNVVLAGDASVSLESGVLLAVQSS